MAHAFVIAQRAVKRAVVLAGYKAVRDINLRVLFDVERTAGANGGYTQTVGDYDFV
jgi:hypothetical protein